MTTLRLRPVVALLALVLFAALPAVTLAVPPDGPPGQKKVKVPKVEVTLQGTVESAPDEKGRPGFSLVADGVSWKLSAGPRWYWRENNPLAPYVGQVVTVVGMSAEGSTEVDVARVNDTEIRAAGKPPWAGGWKRIGSAHPGWSEEKAARWGLKFGDCFPPGQCKATSSPAAETPAG